MELADALAGADALTHLDAAHDAAWACVDGELLGMCRRRMAMLLRHGPTLDAMSAAERGELADWPNSTGLSPLARAALEFTEQYVIDVSAVTDGQVRRVRDHLGETGVVDFVNALLVVEQRMSLELVLEGAL